MPDSDPDATVREIVEEAIKIAEKQGQHIITFDFEKEEVGEYVMMVIATGKEARNNIARLLNTFLDYEGAGEDI